MNVVRWTPIKRYWLLFVISLFCLLNFAVDRQAIVLAQLPTPDVKTVPDLDDLVTPTPTTAVPIQVVTATPAPGATSTTGSTNTGTSDNSPGNSLDNSPPAPPASSNSAPPASSGAAVPVAPGAPTNGTALVNTGALNVRAEPNTTSPVIDQLVRNTVITLLNQGADPTWWYICCGSTNNLPGWVNGQYLVITSGGTGTTTSTAISETTSVADGAQPPLQVELIPQQRFVWQGQHLTVQFKITNPKSVKIRLLSIRTDLPPALSFLAATTSVAGQQEIQGQASAGPVVTLAWPEVAPNTTVTATLDLQIATEVANGAFIDLIAAVSAEGEATILSGIQVIMPPKQLPLFR